MTTESEATAAAKPQGPPAAPRRKGGPNHNGGWNAADHSGRRFNDLVARVRVGIDPGTGSAVWLCECVKPTASGAPCGGAKEVRGTLLENGQVKSCGCRRRARGAERTPRRPAAAMLGQVYGALECEVLLKAEKPNDGMRWRCACRGGGPGCRGAHTARAKDLRSGNTKSCGCLAGRGGKGVSGGAAPPRGGGRRG